jgi:hypothetical protein
VDLAGTCALPDGGLAMEPPPPDWSVMTSLELQNHRRHFASDVYAFTSQLSNAWSFLSRVPHERAMLGKWPAGLLSTLEALHEIALDAKGSTERDQSALAELLAAMCYPGAMATTTANGAKFSVMAIDGTWRIYQEFPTRIQKPQQQLPEETEATLRYLKLY